MADDIAQSYGSAIVAIGRAEGAADRVTDELLQFAHAVDANPTLRSTLTDAAIPLEARAAAAEELLRRAHPATATVVQLLLASDRIRHVSEIADSAVRQSADARGASVATVRTAKALTDGQHQDLAKALAARAGRPVEMKVIVDPELMGGLTVQLGDTIIDGTVAKRLTDLRASLAST